MQVFCCHFSARTSSPNNQNCWKRQFEKGRIYFRARRRFTSKEIRPYSPKNQDFKVIYESENDILSKISDGALLKSRRGWAKRYVC